MSSDLGTRVPAGAQPGTISKVAERGVQTEVAHGQLREEAGGSAGRVAEGDRGWALGWISTRAPGWLCLLFCLWWHLSSFFSFFWRKSLEPQGCWNLSDPEGALSLEHGQVS